MERLADVTIVQTVQAMHVCYLRRAHVRNSVSVYALNLCTSSKKSRRVLALHACVLQESRQCSPSLFVSSGKPAQGSF